MIQDNLFGMGNIILNFNRENVKIYVSKSSAFIGGYELHVSARCSNEKLKEIAKIEKKVNQRKKASIADYNPAFAQLRFFLRGLGIPTERMDYPSRDIDKRASKGVKSISLKYWFKCPYLAYALGLDLTSFYGSGKLPNTKEEIINREEFARREVQRLQDLQFSNRQKVEQKAIITQQSSDEIWKNEFQPSWAEELKKVEDKGISYSHIMSRSA